LPLGISNWLRDCPSDPGPSVAVGPRKIYLRKVLLQLFLLAVIDYDYIKGQMQVYIRLKAEVG